MAVDSDSEGQSQTSSKSSWFSRKSRAIKKSKLSSKALPSLKFKAANKSRRAPLNQAKSQPRLLQNRAFLYTPSIEGLDIA
mmetsp:Transcript_41465/g.63271  ORF Transcript_41465/g.63271 Transcript_41465/m.63271 type:complete len:81 (+) Transcript_41465:139-381(+)